MTGVDLLEHVDRAGSGRINSLAVGVEPQIVDAEHARDGCHHRARPGVDRGKSSKLQGGCEQAVIVSSNAWRGYCCGPESISSPRRSSGR
jgi:hypothetical protein